MAAPAILLVGADGQLGRAVARQRGPFSLRALGRAALDITDRGAVLEAVREAAPDVVVNAAAFTAVDAAEEHPAAAFAVNRDGAAHLAEACAARGVPLIHISTDYVFDGTRPGFLREDDPVAPLGVYGASKLAGEEAVRAVLPRHVILRTSWLYGTDGANFVRTMLRLGAERQTLRVVDDQHGCPTAAPDLASAVTAIAGTIAGREQHPEAFGTFHCAGSGATTWFGLARAIFDAAGPRMKAVPLVEPIRSAEYPTRAQRPANSRLDCTRLERVHGVRLRPWREALTEVVNALLPPPQGDRAQ